MPHHDVVRPLRASALALVLAAGAVLGPAGPAGADDPWTVPDDATIALDGLGFGHGRGLSQYGALGRANAGHDYRDIVEFYYDGARWGSATGSLKVLVTGDTSRDVVVAPRAGLTVRSLGSGKKFTLPAKVAGKKVTRWRIVPGAGGRSVVDAKAGRWREWRELRGDAELAAGGAPVALRTPDGVVAYRGALRSASPSGPGRDRDTVNVVPLESYLRGVVPREVPALWPAAAVRAQAVAARTYAAYERAHPSASHYDLCDTDHCQVYAGTTDEHRGSDAAVRATAHRIVKADGGPAFAQFSASNGGWTDAGPFDYLVAKQDTFDHYDPDGTGGDGWATTVTAARIEREYDLENLVSIAVETRDGNGRWGGRVETVRLGTEKTPSGYVVTGESFRSHLGLRSSWFTVTGVTEGP